MSDIDLSIAAALRNGADEDECSMSTTGEHVDPRLDPDWNEVICSACHEVIEP